MSNKRRDPNDEPIRRSARAKAARAQALNDHLDNASSSVGASTAAGPSSASTRSSRSRQAPLFEPPPLPIKLRITVITRQNNLSTGRYRADHRLIQFVTETQHVPVVISNKTCETFCSISFRRTIESLNARVTFT
ncbi:unnamed protein product [Sympodiomycopsis kandeliae]